MSVRQDESADSDGVEVHGVAGHAVDRHFVEEGRVQPGRRRAVQGVENVGGQAAHAGCLLDVVSGVGAAARRP
jgi:hypothetical protein